MTFATFDSSTKKRPTYLPAFLPTSLREHPLACHSREIVFLKVYWAQTCFLQRLPGYRIFQTFVMEFTCQTITNSPRSRLLFKSCIAREDFTSHLTLLSTPLVRECFAGRFALAGRPTFVKAFNWSLWVSSIGAGYYLVLLELASC